MSSETKRVGILVGFSSFTASIHLTFLALKLISPGRLIILNVFLWLLIAAARRCRTKRMPSCMANVTTPMATGIITKVGMTIVLVSSVGYWGMASNVLVTAKSERYHANPS